jgi:hypothetical protein
MDQSPQAQSRTDRAATEHSHSSVATHRRGERTRTYVYRPRPEARM